MRRKNSVFAMSLTLLLTLLMIMPVYAFSPPAVVERVENERTYLPLRAAIYAEFDARVEWQAESRSVVIITDANEPQTVSVSIDEVGFIENGVSWVPVVFFEDVLYPQLIAVSAPGSVTAQDEENVDHWSFDRFSDIRDASFSTDLPHGEIAVGFIEYISDNFGGRSAFTQQEKATATWIVEELLAMGHDWDAIEVQEFDYWQLIDRELGLIPASWDLITHDIILGVDRDYQLREDRVSQNIILTLPGQSQSDNFIIVGAHYDSVPYPGASDNASGVGLLLESAQRMIDLDHYYTIVYVFFGAEEVGLLGAFYYYESLSPAEHENVIMMINADVLIEGPYPIFGAGMIPTIDDDTAEAIISAILDVSLAEIEEAFEAELMQVPAELIDELPEIIAAQIAALHPTLFALQGYIVGLLETTETNTSRRIDTIANAIIEEHDLKLIRLPEAVIFTSDNLAFAMRHTVLNLFGAERVENIDGERIPMGMQVTHEFAATVLHSPYDEFNRIEYLWPGMMSANLQTFSLLLEAVLTARFS